MIIVDAHTHLGTCNVFDLDVPFESLLGAMDANGVRTALVQPFPGCEEPVKLHDRIAAGVLDPVLLLAARGRKL